MPIQIPRTNLEILPTQIVVKMQDRTYLFNRQVSPFQTTAQIDASQYALVQQGDRADSAISMIQEFDSLQFYSTNLEVFRKGLIVPTPKEFLINVKNVNYADTKEGVLYDALGNLIEGKKLTDYAQRINHNCWNWLNARFPNGKGFNGLDLLTITGLDSTQNPVSTRAPLEGCLGESCFAELDSLNSQGLPTRKSQVQKYSPGDNIYFYLPVLRKGASKEGYVARFGADSSGAFLDCVGRPGDSDPSLGVFAIAREAS